MTEKENHLPNLSSEERAHALELAIQARRRYAALKARVKSGELTFTDAIDEEDAKRILVASLLQSVPGIGASKTEFIMRLYRIPKSKRVGGLGIRQREALVALEKNGWKNGIDFVFAGDGNPRWRHLGFLVSGQAGNPAEKAWERVRRHPLFHAFSALALIEYQCSPAKAALRVARFGKWVLKVHSSGLFNSLPSCSRAAFGALTGGRLRLETWQFRITEFS